MAIANYAALAATTGTADPVFVQGRSNAFDGGQGFFYWDTISTEGGNDGTVIVQTGVTIGRWKRVYSGSYNAQWFGLIPGSSTYATANTANLQALINYLNNSARKGGVIYLPAGEYFFNDTVTLKEKVTLEGDLSTHQARYNWAAKGGTVLLFDVAANANCIAFEEKGFKITMRNLSIYINNTNAIKSVVNITGVFYPLLENVEIGSTGISTGTGLYLSSSTSTPIRETLYGVFNNVTISANDIGESSGDASLNVGLHIVAKHYDTSSPAVVNANTFNGCHIIGRKHPLVIEKDSNQAVHNQSLTFTGCTFESYYYSGYASLLAPNVITNSSMLHGVGNSGTWVIFKWIKIDAAWTTSFFGCYFELQALPSSIDVGGTNYTQIIAAIDLGTNSVSTSFDNCRLITAILDNGVANSAQCLPNGYQYYTYEKPRLIVTKSVAQTITAYSYQAVSYDDTPGGLTTPYDMQRNVIDFINNTTVVAKERGTYFIKAMVTFNLDFGAGGVYFCNIRIVTSYGTYYGPLVYGSGSTTDTISAEASCMVTLNAGDVAYCEVIQNTGVSKNTTAAAASNYLDVLKL